MRSHATSSGVERAASAALESLQRPLVFVMGKGGTGKTTVAGALATEAAMRGRRAAVCELSGQRRLEHVLPASVTHVSIATDVALREWLRRQPGGAAAAALLSGSAAFQQLVAAAPGVAELITVGKIGDLVESGDFDTVIVDAPATGHAIGLVTAPRTYAGIAHAGRISRDASQLQRLLEDGSRTAYLGVTLPEEMPVRELLELDATLTHELGRRLDAVVVNEVWPVRLSETEARWVRTIASHLEETRSRAFAHAALAEHRRAQAHARALTALRGALDVPLAVLPRLRTDPLGPEELAQLGAALGAPVVDTAPGSEIGHRLRKTRKRSAAAPPLRTSPPMGA